MAYLAMVKIGQKSQNTSSNILRSNHDWHCTNKLSRANKPGSTRQIFVTGTIKRSLIPFDLSDSSVE